MLLGFLEVLNVLKAYILHFIASSPSLEIDSSFKFWPNDVIQTFSFHGHKRSIHHHTIDMFEGLRFLSAILLFLSKALGMV